MVGTNSSRICEKKLEHTSKPAHPCAKQFAWNIHACMHVTRNGVIVGIDEGNSIVVV